MGNSNKGKVISLRKNNMNGKMAKAYKGEYVKYNLDYLNKLIYNDLSIDELFYDEEDKYKTNLIKILSKGEEAKHLPFLRDEYHITNFGRIINAKRIKELTIVLVRNEFLAFTANARLWKLEPIMLDNNWTYDMNLMLDYYKSIDYPFRKEKC